MSGIEILGALGSVSGTISLVGTAASIAASLKSAEAQKAALRFNQQTALSNARAARRKAEADQIELRKNLYRVKGAQAAAAGASGISGGSGSALDILAETVTQGTLDAQRIQEGADIASGSYSAQADILGKQGSTATSNGNLNAASQLLIGLGDVARRR